MYNVSEDRPRGTPSGQSSREFPVLFHLMDVSRPKASKQAPAIESANLLNAVAQLRWPPAGDHEKSPPSAAVSEPTAVALEVTPVVEATAAAPEPAIVAAEVAPAMTENVTAAEPPAEENSAAAETAEVIEASVPEVVEPRTPAPPPPSVVTLRKKPRTSRSEDWFASHGKYIAVAFVLALAATIYFARVNRERNSVALLETTTKQETQSQPPLIDTTSAVAVTKEPVQNPLPAASTAQTASAAAPATPSPVELRAPQLVESSPDKRKDNLFEFAAGKNADDRVASRTDDPAKSTAAAQSAGVSNASVSSALSQPALPETAVGSQSPAAPSTTPTETTAYPVTSSPAPQYPAVIPPAAAYPTTSPAPGGAPALAPPAGSIYQSQPQSQYAPPSFPAAAPPTDYRSQYPVTPASLPQQPAGQAWNAGQPASYPSYDSTARGPRNERTGSGNY